MNTSILKNGARLAALTTLAVFASGCDPQVALSGLVTDTSGAPLPGVSVKVDGTETFAISNGNGYFGKRPGRLTVPPGDWVLRFMKTGFTTAELPVSAGDSRAQEVHPVVLWPLPAARGIYDWSDFRYEGWTRVEPERFSSENLAPIFGTRQEPELRRALTMGRIVGYKVSPYDWRLSRLEEVSVLRPGIEGVTASDPNATEMVWVESVRIPVQAIPIDEPEQMLWEIRPTRTLGPGVYALHWGALEGDPSTDPSAYIIEVSGPPEAEPAPEGEEAPAESESDEGAGPGESESAPET